MSDDDDHKIGRQIVSTMRRKIEPAHGATIVTFRNVRNNLPSPQRGQRPRNPRLKEDHKSRFSIAPASRLQIWLVGLIVSMTRLC